MVNASVINNVVSDSATWSADSTCPSVNKSGQKFKDALIAFDSTKNKLNPDGTKADASFLNSMYVLAKSYNECLSGAVTETAQKYASTQIFVLASLYACKLSTDDKTYQKGLATASKLLDQASALDLDKFTEEEVKDLTQAVNLIIYVFGDDLKN